MTLGLCRHSRNHLIGLIWLPDVACYLMYDFKTVTYSNVHFHCLRLASFSIVSAFRAASVAMLCLPACLFTCTWRNDDDDDNNNNNNIIIIRFFFWQCLNGDSLQYMPKLRPLKTSKSNNDDLKERLTNWRTNELTEQYRPIFTRRQYV